MLKQEAIAAYCHPENKVALVAEGPNDKIRVLQRRAYDLPICMLTTL